MPAGIAAGKRLRIREKGIAGEGGAAGDQYAGLVIQLPPDLTEAEKQQLAAMDQGHGFNPRKDVGW